VILFFIAAGLIAVYIFLAVWIISTLSRSFARQLGAPTVSVIVAARNEEHNLPHCLAALARLDYPADKIEFIIVNDHSTDRTPDIIDSFCRMKPGFIALHLQVEKAKPGKSGALLAAIEQSRGEVIFFTDADCVPPTTWIRGLLARLQPDVGIVGGFTTLQPIQSIGEKVQALDWLFLLSAASAASLLNYPISWVGNNLAFRRQAYDQVGGFLQIEDSLIEDFALINAVRNKTSWRCSFIADPETTVVSRPASTLNELYNQRKRWGTGIRRAPFFGLLLMGVVFTTHLLSLIALLYSPLILFAVVGKIVADWCIIRKTSHRLSQSIKFQECLLFEGFYFLYSIFLPFLFLVDRRFVWKDVVFRRD